MPPTCDRRTAHALVHLERTTGISNVRRQKKERTIRVEEIRNEKNLGNLTHDGWGTGEEWQAVRAYFDRAWGQVVLPRLQKRFMDGPILWDELD